MSECELKSIHEIANLLTTLSTEGCASLRVIKSATTESEPWQWDDNEVVQWDNNSEVQTD